VPETRSSLEEFRRAAHAFLAEHGVPATTESALLEGSRAPGVVASEKALQRKMFDAGFAGITWPREYGGQGLPEEYQRTWAEECAGYVMPSIFRMSFGMCGPTLVDVGSHEQKARYIRPMLRGEEVWCQLFSEPGAGSDVAGLTTRAERVDDGWLVNGQKVWTSGAHIAAYGILIARTDPNVPKHQGISMFVVDMRSSGITVRPLKVMTGDTPFNEVFLDDVHLPADALIGEVGAGWQLTLLMLSHERIALGLAPRPQAHSYQQLLQSAREHGTVSSVAVRERLASLFALETAATLLSHRLRQEKDAGIDIGARGSIAKLAGSYVGIRAVDVADEVAGTALAFWAGAEWDAVTRGVAQAPASSIAGGTSQIQRNLIGERVLGLPREPSEMRKTPRHPAAERIR
jgi:alkylation response protein AidB-like acyl-CoA dehydrogenase